MSDHNKYHFSITIHTNDLAVLNCLRALSQHSQQTGNSRIPWGGTKKEEWKKNNNKATFHFSCEKYRNYFIEEINRILPCSLLTIVNQRDDDPASPQNI